MLTDVLTKSLRDQRWSLLGWEYRCVLLVVFESAVWPTMRDMANFDELVKGYPDAMKDLFDLDAASTAPLFLNLELFTLVLLMLFIIFAGSRGPDDRRQGEAQHPGCGTRHHPCPDHGPGAQNAAALAVPVFGRRDIRAI